MIRLARRCEAGTTAVEFAFIGMTLIVLTLGLIEFGRGFYLYTKLGYAVDLAARTILTTPAATDQALRDEVIAAYDDDTSVPSITITSGSTGSGTTLVRFRTVDVSIPFEPLIPNLTGGPINLRVTRRVPLVQVP